MAELKEAAPLELRPACTVRLPEGEVVLSWYLVYPSDEVPWDAEVPVLLARTTRPLEDYEEALAAGMLAQEYVERELRKPVSY